MRLLGKGVTIYSVLPTTRGPPSCPCGIPVLIVPTTCRLCDVAGIDFVQRAVTRVAVVAGGHGPLAVGHGRDQMDIRECAGNVGRHPLRLCFELAHSEKQGAEQLRRLVPLSLAGVLIRSIVFLPVRAACRDRPRCRRPDLGEAKIGHRGLWLDCAGMLNPAGQIAGRVRQFASDHGPLAEIKERWTDKAARAVDAGNHVAGAAAVD